jgi:hypothetical protein
MRSRTSKNDALDELLVTAAASHRVMGVAFTFVHGQDALLLACKHFLTLNRNSSTLRLLTRQDSSDHLKIERFSNLGYSSSRA